MAAAVAIVLGCNNDLPTGSSGGKGGEGGDGSGGGGGGEGGAGAQGGAGAGGGSGGEGGSGGSVDPCLGSFRAVSKESFEALVAASCSEIKGFVEIGYRNVTTLEGLETLTSIGEHLAITDTIDLASLKGLNNLTSVGGDLTLDLHPSLKSLAGLGKLTTVGGSIHLRRTAVTTVAALKSLESVAGTLDIDSNDALTALTGLEQVTSVGGLRIYFNGGLTSLDPLHAWPAKAVKGPLYIAVNRNLPACEVEALDAEQTDPAAECPLTGKEPCLGNDGIGTCD